MHEIYKRRKITPESIYHVIIATPIYSPSCKVLTRYFEIVIPSCSSYQSVQAIEVVGRVDGDSDEHIFDRKSLVVTDISGLDLSYASPKDWPLLLQHRLNLARQRLFLLILDEITPYQGGIVVAIVFGNTDWLDRSIQPYFKITGTLHILAASGQNIALLVLLTQSLLPSFIHSKLQGIALLLITVVYVALIGVQPSIFRALLMSVQSIVARYMLNVQYKSYYGLLLSAGILLIFWPEWLYSMGYLLSVSATAGIIFLYPKITSFLSSALKLLPHKIMLFLQKRPLFIGSYIVESSASGVAAQLATFPVVFTQFGSVSVLAWIPSTMVGWLVPVILQGTVISLLTEFLPATWQISSSAFYVFVWAPVDLFLYILQLASGYDWLIVVNPWQK